MTTITKEQFTVLPENMQNLYDSKGDDEFALNQEKLQEFAGLTPLKGALQKERQLHKDASDKLKTWQSLGETPESVHEQLITLQQSTQSTSSKVKDIDIDEIVKSQKAENDKYLNKQRQTYEEQMSVKDGWIKQLEEQLQNQKKTTQLENVIIRSGIDPKYVSMVMATQSHKFALSDKGSLIMIDEEDIPTAHDPLNYMMTTHKDEYSALYTHKGTGSGINTSGSIAGSNGKIKIRRGDNAARMKYMKEIEEGKAVFIE